MYSSNPDLDFDFQIIGWIPRFILVLSPKDRVHHLQRFPNVMRFCIKMFWLSDVCVMCFPKAVNNRFAAKVLPATKIIIWHLA